MLMGASEQAVRTILGGMSSDPLTPSLQHLPESSSTPRSPSTIPSAFKTEALPKARFVFIHKEACFFLQGRYWSLLSVVSVSNLAFFHTSGSRRLKPPSDIWRKFKQESKRQDDRIPQRRDDIISPLQISHSDPSDSILVRVTRQRFLTLAFGKLETVRAFPDTFADLEAIVHDWIKPAPNTPFSLRVPVEYASIPATRLITGPYVYITGEESFQIAIMNLDNLRVEIVSDALPRPNRSLLGSLSSSSVATMKANLDGTELTPASPDAANSSFASLCDWFTAVLVDQSKYRTLLAFRDETAQRILDVIQVLLDDPRIENPNLRKGLLSALGVERESEPVASGHFGEIWKGRYEGQKVCLKMVKVFQTSQVEHLLKAFCKEAIVWKHLSHPNVLPFYGIYHVEDLHNRVCLVSPWMENGNVIDFLKRKPNVVRLLLISDILEGISYLHDKNIVHGDIKGVNVVVTEMGRACLVDFGLSSLIDADILRWTSVASTAHASGTVRWQAQELFDSDDGEIRPTKASDIYSFSCTCYEIFTGRVPYHQITRDSSVILKVMQGGRPSRPGSSIENSLCRERGMTGIMWELMEACWHPDPAMRPTAKQALLRLPFETTRGDAQKDSNILSSFEFCSTTRMPIHISANEVAEIISLIS